MLVLPTSPKIMKEEQIFDKIILYLDMDAYFAAVEQRENPKLKGKPMIVGGNPKTKRGVVVTCSYEAREYGIRSGMAVAEAVKLCPELLFASRAYPLYTKISRNILEIAKQYSKKTFMCSIDELFMDVTDIVETYEDAEGLAYELKDEINSIEKLSCSIGIGPTITVARMACDIDKPNGLTIIKPSRIKEFLNPLKVSKIPGVGKKTEERFNKQNIVTCGDLAKKKITQIYEDEGENGVLLWKFVHGYNTEKTEELYKEYQRKSIGEERTFYYPPQEWSEIWNAVDELIENIIKVAEYHGTSYRTVGIKIKNRNFESETRNYSLSSHVNSKTTLKRIVSELMQEYKKMNLKTLRLLGIRISNLKKTEKKQLNLTKFITT